MRNVCFLACAASFAASLSAQFVGPGLAWDGTSGNGTRSFAPSCTTLAVVAVPGETVTTTVWGDFQAPYLLLADLGPTGVCTPIPGLDHGLLLVNPVSVQFGFLNFTSPCLACPPGFDSVSFLLPSFVPPGTSLSLQAASFGNNRASFTVAITGTT